MSRKWKEVLNEEVENRPIQIKKSDEDQFKVETISSKNEKISADSPNVAFADVPASVKGQKSTWISSSLDELRDDLLQVGFSGAAVDRILNKIGT